MAIASKALQPLPALHKDLNEDTRTRKPYIGMIADENIRNMVRNRSKAVASLRRTFDDHDFLEVETPMLQTLHGGAAARPFTTHMNAFDLDLYLRIAPELFLKRCLVGGIDRVFEINRDFRNEASTPRTPPNSPWSRPTRPMAPMIPSASWSRSSCRRPPWTSTARTRSPCSTAPNTTSAANGRPSACTIRCPRHWARKSCRTAALSIPAPPLSIWRHRDKLGVERDDVENHGKLVEHLWEHFYEDKLYEPPSCVTSRSKPPRWSRAHRTKPGVVEKWDLYVRGFELATGYSELNDPIVQRERFVAQAKDALAGDEEPATSMRTSSRLSAWACLRPAVWVWALIDCLSP